MTCRPATRGFTILELLISMGIFTILGTMVIYLMTTSLDMFQQGIEEAGVLNRQDAVLPVIEEDLGALRVVSNTEAPVLQREPDPMAAPTADPVLPPMVGVRMRSGRVKMKAAGKLKDFMAKYVSFIVDISEGLDPTIAQLDTSGGPGSIDVTPKTVRTATRATRFKATQGMMEVLYIVAPTDPDRPDILTLYRGFRSPIGDPEHSLLEPTNFDTRAKIAKICEPVSDGVLYFGVTWRRVFATSWDLADRRRGTNGDLTRYVGPDWDSTRGADLKWAMHAGKESLRDPSDDIFPAFVRVVIVMGTPTRFGYGVGDLRLSGAVGKTETKIRVDDVDVLFAPGLGRQRWLKIGSEWMGYRTEDVDYAKREVSVTRAGRGTRSQAHESDAGIHLGSATSTEIRLPVYRDRFTLPEER